MSLLFYTVVFHDRYASYVKQPIGLLPQKDQENNLHKNLKPINTGVGFTISLAQILRPMPVSICRPQSLKVLEISQKCYIAVTWL